MTTITPIQVTTRVEKVMTQTDLAVATILNLGIHTYVSFPNFIPFFLIPISCSLSFLSVCIVHKFDHTDGVHWNQPHVKAFYLSAYDHCDGCGVFPGANHQWDRRQIQYLWLWKKKATFVHTFWTADCLDVSHYLHLYFILFYYFTISSFLYFYSPLHSILCTIFFSFPLFIYFFKLNRQLQPHLFRVLDFHASIVLTLRDLVNMVVSRPWSHQAWSNLCCVWLVDLFRHLWMGCWRRSCVLALHDHRRHRSAHHGRGGARRNDLLHTHRHRTEKVLSSYWGMPFSQKQDLCSSHHHWANYWIRSYTLLYSFSHTHS